MSHAISSIVGIIPALFGHKSGGGGAQPPAPEPAQLSSSSPQNFTAAQALQQQALVADRAKGSGVTALGQNYDAVQQLNRKRSAATSRLLG